MVDKVKLGLTILSMAIIVVPLIVEVYAYQNNLVGLVLPPQISNLINGGNSNNNGSNGTQGSQSSQLPQSSIPNFQLPQAVGQPQYDPSTGAFSAPFNFTNPLTSQISIDQFSAQVVGANNALLGNVSITPVTVAAGQTALLNVTGNLSQQAVNQLETQYQSGNLNVSLKNVNVNLAGVSVQIPQINDIGSILANFSPKGSG